VPHRDHSTKKEPGKKLTRRAEQAMDRDCIVPLAIGGRVWGIAAVVGVD
jgi:ribosomal protein L4